MNRFFVSPSQIEDEEIFITEGEDVNHIKNVLRLRPGELIEISDGFEWEYIGEIASIDSDKVAVQIEDKQKQGTEPKIKFTLFQGVPKAKKLDIIIRECTELGISAIGPVFMKRSVVSPKGNMDKKVARMEGICLAAAKQSGRGIIPKIIEPSDFPKMMESLSKFDHVIFPYEDEKKTTIKDALRGIKETIEGKRDPESRKDSGEPPKIAIVIGPEGGFSEKEVEDLKRLENCHCVSLGKSILRTETAGMAALTMCMYELEL